MSQRFLTSLLLFLGIFLILQSLLPSPTPEDVEVDDFVVESIEESYYPGDEVIITITNNLDKSFRIDSNCPSHPLEIERYSNGQWNVLETENGVSLRCGSSADDGSYFVQPNEFEFVPNETKELSYNPWKDELFSEIGKYRASLEIEVEGENKTFMKEFEVVERGFFASLYFQLLHRPIFNLMVFLTSIMPGYNFGLAVILLTLLIRLVLLIPNQKALKSQKAMMDIQPQLEEIRNKYKGDQQKISQETMKVWQENSVNPVGGCLPMLVQIPIMIALFYTVKAGFTPFESHAMYSFLQHFDLSLVNQDFYGILDLQKVNASWLPIIVGLSQFTQMKLSFSRRKKKKVDDKKVVDIDDKGKVLEKKKDDKKSKDPDPMKVMNKTMIYFMPIMIAVLVATLPSAVGIYLLISSLFGVGQQYFIQRNS